MLKRLTRYKILILILLIASVRVSAQTLSVESFKLLPNDLTANTYGTQERDQNGDVAALIKMVTSETGFVFDGGMMGIVKTEQKTGEVWIYVPHGLQRITISHQQLGVLRDYYFPVPIEKARTYELRLVSARVRTVVEEELSAQYVTFSVDPKNAMVYIDGTAYLPQNDGTVSQLLSYGNHEYRVELPGYKTESGVVQVGREKVVKEIKMQSSKATITLVCAMPEADIYINDEKVGQGTWTGQLAAAMYKVESKRDGHQTRLVSLTVREFEERTVTVPDPIPIYGKIQIQSDPYNAVVYLDGEEIGNTPLLHNDVIIGEHKLLIRKEDYHDYHATITVEDGKIARHDAVLDNSFVATIASTPKSAKVSLNGEYKGVTPLTLTIVPGDYDLEVSKRSYNPYKDKVHLSATSPSYTARLTKQIFSSSDIYLGTSYIVPISHPEGMKGSFNVQAGFYVKNFNFQVDVGYVDYESIYGYWTMMPEDLNGDGVLDGTHSYSFYTYLADNEFGVRLGYGIIIGNRLRITPQAGVKYIEMTMNSEMNSYHPLKSHVLSTRFDLKTEFSPVKHLSLFIDPSYVLPVKMGQIAGKIDEKKKEVSTRLGGIFGDFGISLYF